MNNAYLIVVCIIIGAGFGMALTLYFARVFRNKRYTDIAEHAHFAEKEAESFLQKHGFTIIERQKRAPVITYIDGKSHLSYVQADFIVKKDNRCYVVEVKTGGMADPAEPIVRRQLLEYDYVFNLDGIIFLNMEQKTLQYIEFEMPKGDDNMPFIKTVLGVLIFLMFIGLLVLLRQLRLI